MNNYEKGIEEEIDYTIDLNSFIEDILKGIKKFGWLLIILAILTGGIGCLQEYRNYYPYYTSSATFTVNLSVDTADGSIYNDNLKASQMSKTFPYIITSGVLKSVIASDLGIEYVSDSITADNVEDTNLFTIKVTSGDANRAYDVLQSVIKNYPTIAEMVVGSTRLNILDQTGIPQEATNQIDYKSSGKKGALVGVFLGTLIILTYAFTRKTIHKVDDLTEISNMKHLGTLPVVLFKKRGKKFNTAVTLSNEKISSWYRENMYKIRTRVDKIANNGQMKTILVTSAIQGEGKSTFAFNLAITLAEEGKNVVLVDCDLRHPSIKNMLTLQEESVGIDKVLNGEVELKDALRYYQDLNITVLAGTKPAKKASEIIGTMKMKDILNQLGEKEDYIILDTSPSAILTDTSALAKFVDGAIFVVKQDYAKMNQILDGLDHLSESSNINFIGLVLNSARAGIGGYGYGKYGYGKYGRYGSANKIKR